MKLWNLLALATICLVGTNLVAEEKKTEKAVSSIHDLQVKALDGTDVDLSKYKGKVLLVVNVASECGATPQYEQLQALHQQYAAKGLVVMGVPCNQFGSQEPGTSQEIRQFCDSRYSVKFPMFEKLNVNGADEAPLYTFLKSNADDHSNIGWNFEKFIVGKDGKVVARFKTRTKPDAPEVVKIIEEQLAL